MDYVPTKNRVIVKIKTDDYEKKASGLFIHSEDEKTESMHNLIKATLEKVGNACEDFVQESIGVTVLIHEVSGVPMNGAGGKNYRLMREDDIMAYLPPELDNTEEINTGALFSLEKTITAKADGRDYHNEVIFKDAE